MKKSLAILVVFALIAGSVFGLDLSVGVSADANTNLIFASKGTGKFDDGNTSGTIGNVQKGSVSGGGNYDGTPATNDDGAWNATMGIALNTENAELAVDFVINRDRIKDETADVGSFFKYDGWHASGNIGIFDGYIGTGGYGGRTGGGKIIVPFWDGGAFNPYLYIDESDDDDLAGGNLDFVGAKPLLAIGIQPFEMIKLAVGTNVMADAAHNEWGSTSSVSYAFLVSGGVADMVDFDVFYGIKGYDSNTAYRDEDWSSGYWRNMFGIYAKVGIGDLGIGFGYTINNDVYSSYTGWKDDDENHTDDKKARNVYSPFYNGIDLNIGFTGIDKVGVHFNNNFSFAGIKGKKDATTITIPGVLVPGGLNKDGEASYFVYAGELGGSYQFTDNLGFSLALTEKAGITTGKGKEGDDTVTAIATKNTFGIDLGAAYGIGPVSLSCGLNLEITARDVKITGRDETFTASTNVVTFKIPVKFGVSF